MKNPVFTGACTALVTPFEGTEINLAVFDELIERQLEARIDALVICGTTAESATLSDEEKMLLISHAIQRVNGRCKIIAGTGSNNTVHAMHLSKLAQSYGADAILSVTPYYNKTTPDGLFKHYEAICKSVSIPIIAYNVPARTGMSISLETYQRLDQIPNLNGVKEASADVPLVSRIISSCSLNVWSGCDELTVPLMTIGAKGVISTLGNILPKTVKQICDRCLTGNFADAGKLQNENIELIDLLFSATNPLPVKAALEMMKIDVGECRLPLYIPENLKLEIQQKISKLLAKQGISE